MILSSGSSLPTMICTLKWRMLERESAGYNILLTKESLSIPIAWADADADVVTATAEDRDEVLGSWSSLLAPSSASPLSTATPLSATSLFPSTRPSAQRRHSSPRFLCFWSHARRRLGRFTSRCCRWCSVSSWRATVKRRRHHCLSLFGAMETAEALGATLRLLLVVFCIIYLFQRENRNK